MRDVHSVADVTDRMRFVEALWTEFEAHGPEGVVGLASGVVKWPPASAGGGMLHVSAKAMEHFDALRRQGALIEARAFGFEEQGSCVLVSGSLRTSKDHGFNESYRYWVFRFDGDELRCVESLSSREAALLSCGAPTSAAAPAGEPVTAAR